MKIVAVPDETLAAARALVGAGRAALATLDREGWPYVSLVLVAQDDKGWPLMLLSDLAEHSKNIARDGRVSLLFDGTTGMAEPLAGPRLTLIGRIEPASDPTDLARYVARHQEAKAWVGMQDFRLHRLAPARAHLVAGFGRIAWIDAMALFSRDN
jgi:heme iron utilization protein